jgi:hypothetical protein
MAMVPCLKRVAVCVAVAGTLLVACGDDEESSAPTTTVAPTTSTTLSQAQLDHQKAERVVLAAADVPGYTMNPPDPSDDRDTYEAAANTCLNNNLVLVQLGDDGDPRGVAGADFSKGDDVSVYSAVTFAETGDRAKAAITDAGAATVGPCLARALAAELRNDPSLTNVSVTSAKLPALTVGDQSLGYRFTVKARAGGTALTTYVDFTFIRSGRGVAVFQDNSDGKVFPEAERARLATVLAGRMAAP